MSGNGSPARQISPMSGMVSPGRPSRSSSAWYPVIKLCGVLILVVVLLAWISYLLGVVNFFTTTTTTLHPALIVTPRIHHPWMSQQQLLRVFVDSAALSAVGALIGVMYWAAGAAARSCVLEGKSTIADDAIGQLCVSMGNDCEWPATGTGYEEPLIDRSVSNDVPFPEDSVLQQFLSLADSQPGAQAICCAEGDLWSLARLRGLTLQAASLMRTAGVVEQSIVAICLEGGPPLLVSILGAWANGAAWFPIDPATPALRARDILHEGKAVAVVCEDVALFSSSGVPLLMPESVMGCFLIASNGSSLQPLSQRNGTPRAPHVCNPANVAQIIFTSGSTGLPKGVIYSHRRIAHACYFFAQQCGINSSARVLQKTPHIWAVFRHEIFPALCHGGQIVFADARRRKDPAYLAETARQRTVNVIVATPTILDLILDAAAGPLPSLRTAVCMGEGLPVQLAAKVHNRMRGANFQLLNFFGSTETENTVYDVPRPGTAAWEFLSAKRFVPAGRPQPHTSVHILDPSSLDLVPHGAEGEICFGGIISDGYWGRPKLTEERFVHLAGLGRIYRTGDIGRLNDQGDLEVVGRADRQVKIRGMRVELGEVEAGLRGAVEAAVAEGHIGAGAQSEVAAVAAPVHNGADGDLRIVGFATPELLDVSGLRCTCELRMPAHLIPSVIVTLPALPRLPNQKIDLRELSRLATERAQEETVTAIDSLGVLRARTRGQLEEDRWIQNQQAFWMLVVMLGHFQLNDGSPVVDGLDTGYWAWQIEMLLGHGKDMVAFMLMCGFTDSREPPQLAARELALFGLALLMSSPVMSILTPGYGPLRVLFDPPSWRYFVGHGWFVYSLLFARLVLVGMHKCGTRPFFQVVIAFLAAAFTPDDIYTLLLDKDWRIWIWDMNAGIQYKGWRWSFLFMGACYLLGLHAGPPTVRWARSRAPLASTSKATAMVMACLTGFLALSIFTAPSGFAKNGGWATYSHFQAVYMEGEGLTSHLVTWHYMTHPSLWLYVKLYVLELGLYLLPPLCMAVVLAYCPWHFKTMGSTTLGNYVLHPCYIGAPWTRLLQTPVLSRITEPRLGFLPNVVIVFLWNVTVCIAFAHTFGAGFHALLVRLVSFLAWCTKALKKVSSNSV